MNIRKYRNEDKEALVAFWKTVFSNDPPHNAPSKVIEQKPAVDDLIFVEDRMGMGCHI